MHFGNEELLAAINEVVPQKFFKDLLIDLNNAHQNACAHVEKTFSQPVAKDAYPLYRRFIVEDSIKDTARNHEFVANSVLNRRKTASHVEIEIALGSKRMILTTLAVHNCYDMTKLRTAKFRKTLAEESQLSLFKELIEAGDGYYGILLYGAKHQNREIDFAYLGFPTANCKQWYGHYDVFDLAVRASDTEHIKDKSDPKLRKDIKIERREEDDK
ncbi:MAG: hypothetical protein WCG16_10275 [Methylococcales bacterium]